MAKKIVRQDKIKDVAIRSAKTFIQAFLATLSVQVVSIDSWDAIKPVIVASVAAGVSAVWNTALEMRK